MKIRYLSGGIFAFGLTLILAGLAVLFTNHPAEAAGITLRPDVQIEPFTDTACLDCHTSESRLKELAVPVEEEEAALSSGPG